MSFPRYPAYKDSGVPWFGEVPNHWQVAPLKAFIDRIESGVSVNATDTPAEGEQFGVLKTSCVYTGQFDAAENKAIINAEYDRVACPVVANTLIVSRMNTPDLVGAAGLTKADHPTLFLPDRLWQVFPKDTRADFMHFWTRTASYRAQVEMACAGTSSSMQNLGQDDFRSFMFVSPPPDEQAEIADFLDRETAKIDALVAEQEQLITLLKEKRQAVISHAVTKGLDPSATMKDSGIGWLGEVPAHWNVVPLMWLTQPDRPIMYGIVLPGPDAGEGIPILKGGNVKPAKLSLESLARTTPEIEAPYARARLRHGDLVYSIRGSIGDCEIVPPELDGCNITQDVARVAPREEIDAYWLRFTLLSDPISEDLASGSLGAAVRGVNIFDLKRVRLPFPPESERGEIARYVVSKTEAMQDLIDEAANAVALLRERRSALISAAVTGQIDVRGLAPAQEQAA